MSSCEKLFVFCKNEKDEDNVVSHQGLADRASNLYTKIYAATSFIVPEIIAMEEDVLKNTLTHLTGLKYISTTSTKF